MAPRTSARRLLAALGAAAVGVAATLALATPASAHAVKVTADHVCDAATGEWIVTWKVNNDFRYDATIDTLESNPAVEIDGIEVGSVIPRATRNVDGSIEGVQRLPGATTEARLKVKALWEQDNFDDTGEGVEKFKAGGCTPTPRCIKAEDAEFKHTFDKAGKATVAVADGQPELCDAAPFSLVSYYAPAPQFAVPQYVYDKDNTQVVDKDHPKIELNVDIPNCFTQLDLVWGHEIIDPIKDQGDRYGNRKLGSKGAPGNRSTGVTKDDKNGWYNGGTGTCAEPAVEFISDCIGDVTVKLINDASGKYDAPFVVKTADGAEQSVTVAPGTSKKVLVKGEAAASVEVSMDGKVIKSGGWERPADCPPPTLAIKADCDKLTLTLVNPKGNVPAKATVAYGDQTRSVTVAGGASQTVSFPAGTAKMVKATFADLDLTLDAVYKKPASCVAPPGLPVTGANVGGIVGASAAAVVLGGFLFLRFRRRRVTFTA